MQTASDAKRQTLRGRMEAWLPRTVHGFSLHLIVSLVLVDDICKLFRRIGGRPDLITASNEIAVVQTGVRPIRFSMRQDSFAVAMKMRSVAEF